MPAPLISREEILNRLTGAFREFGYHGATINELSAATGLGKASLYHSFKGGKQEMAEAVLDHVAVRFDEAVLAPLRNRGPVRERLTRMVLALGEFYHGGESSCVYELFSVGATGGAFQDRLIRAFAVFSEHLASVAIEAGIDDDTAKRRANEAVIAVQGALVVARGTGDADVFQQTLAALPGRLLATA
ncbi:MAG: TetR/AcrR family transcriptional repressor of lmrAB and yxaGH operons [Hyphomicrobiaceae bacterium]|jgi:TetR/AcrR family transcriptional repressor of lmrAB and yxaGH operons